MRCHFGPLPICLSVSFAFLSFVSFAAHATHVAKMCVLSFDNFAVEFSLCVQ